MDVRALQVSLTNYDKPAATVAVSFIVEGMLQRTVCKLQQAYCGEVCSPLCRRGPVATLAPSIEQAFPHGLQSPLPW